ncbi:MAG: ACP S-malonyltransferase [Candidatus Pelagibacter sp.]
MFSVIFPGQGSQIVGMGKEFYDKFDVVKKIFKEADEILGFSLSKIILEGPKEKLDLTINTQPSIFLVSYSIFQVVKKEFNIDLYKAKYFAGHSLGEYSAIACSGYLEFKDVISILRVRGDAMQNSVPIGEGGMVAVLGAKIENIEKIIEKNNKDFQIQIANDNSEGQIVISGKNDDLEKFMSLLKNLKIKSIKLPVSAPFHCSLMNRAAQTMNVELKKLNFKKGSNVLISNITADEISDLDELKSLLTKQIENRVRWRESVIKMIDNGVNQFIEIGPGKVLSGLVKRIDRNVEVKTINSEEDIKNIIL